MGNVFHVGQKRRSPRPGDPSLSTSCPNSIEIELYDAPRKIRELLVRAGFADRVGSGSHGNFLRPAGVKITTRDNPGDDAKPYQEIASTPVA